MAARVSLATDFFFSYLVNKECLGQLRDKDGSWAVPESVFHPSCLPAHITIGLQTIPSIFTFYRSSSPFPSSSSC